MRVNIFNRKKGGNPLSEEFIKRLNKEINKKENLEDKEIKLNRFQFYKKSNVLKVILKWKESLTENNKKLRCKYKCRITRL